LAVLW